MLCVTKSRLNCRWKAIKSSCVFIVLLIGAISSIESQNATSAPPKINNNNNNSTPLPSATTTSATPTIATNPKSQKANFNDDTKNNSTSPPQLNAALKQQEILSKQLTMSNSNKQQLPSTTATFGDFAMDSNEAKVADATTQFGLNFIRNLDQKQVGLGRKENVLISPLSLQNLLNMILLGSDDNSHTQQELIKVLGYDATELLIGRQSGDQSGHLRPHEAMQSVLNSIMRATQVVPSAVPSNSSSSLLLNSNYPNIQTLDNQNSQKNHSTPTEQPIASNIGQITGHLLQTPSNEQQLPAVAGSLVNFTLANLILTDDSVKLAENYELELKNYYNVNIETFSKKIKKNSSNGPEHQMARTGNDSSSSSTAAPTTAPINNEQQQQLEQVKPLHERVNEWVKNITQNQIEKLAEPGDFEGELQMVLLNAAHFKGRWQYTFNPKSTHEQLFYNSGDDKLASEVKFMRQKANFGYADFGLSSLANTGGGGVDLSAILNRNSAGSKTSALEDTETLLTEDKSINETMINELNKTTTTTTTTTTAAAAAAANQQQQLPIIELSKEESKRFELTSKLNCSVLMLPFALNDGQELSLIILLPTKRNGLSELMGALNYQNLIEIYRSLSEQQVQVELPKFSFETSHDAKEVLREIGLKQMFAEAHLDRMFSSETSKASRKIGKIVHKAKISVDESGAEAAAASMATVFLRNFVRPATPVFIADHPFLFIIRHNRSNMPLFMGQVNQFE